MAFQSRRELLIRKPIKKENPDACRAAANREYHTKISFFQTFQKKKNYPLMEHIEFERLISAQRLSRYRIACGHNTRKTLSLYRANIRLSAAFLSIICLFEVVLRNKIDAHYRAKFPATPEWLIASCSPGGFLAHKGCQTSVDKIMKAYEHLGSAYTHDKLIAELSFGFWKFMFAGLQFQAGGSSLLSIFPNLPFHRNQKFIYLKLDRINKIRNRIAHHEPICFTPINAIGTAYARSHFQEVTDLITYMNINSLELFYGVERVSKEAGYIDNI